MTVFHEKKSFSFLCPCGYGSLSEKEMFEHFLNSHGKTVDFRSPTFRPYWWSALPGFYRHQVCRRCNLKTPLDRFFENHKCVNFSHPKPIPTKLEWQTSIGRNQKPRRPFCTTDKDTAADIGSLSKDFQEKVDLSATYQEESFDSESGCVTLSLKRKPLPPNPTPFPKYAKPHPKNPNHLPSKPNPLPEKSGFDFGTASAALRNLKSAPGFSSHQPQDSKSCHFEEPDLKQLEIYIEGTSRHIPSEDYSAYLQLMNNDGSEIKMRGFLEGHLVDYSAIASTDEVLSCGQYVVTDCNAQIVADVFVTPHFSSRVFAADTIVVGYNPAKLHIVGDMLNLATQPFMMTHHLALSNILKVGEYRITRKSSSGTYATARFWLSNGRKKLSIL